MAKPTERRFDVRMSTELALQFQSISDKTGFTRAEVFRRAVGLYHLAIKNRATGGSLLMKPAPGEDVVEIVGL